MKKYLLRIAAFLTIGTFGLASTSCGSEDIEELVSTFLPILLGQNGESYQYQVNFHAQAISCSDGEKAMSANTEFNGTITVTVYGSKATLNLPGLDLGEMVTMPMEISNFDLTAKEDQSCTIMHIQEGVSPDQGGATINSRQYGITNITLTNAALTSSELAFGEIAIYFGDNQEYCIKFQNITGTVVQGEQ